MHRILAAVTSVAMCCSFSACNMIPGMGGGGGAGGSYTPQECYNNQYSGDLADAKVGRWVSYVSEAGAAKSTMTTKIVGQDGGDWWIESWMDTGSMAYGLLFQVGHGKKITKAWATPKDGKEWKEISVKEPAQSPAGGDGPKPAIKESSEKKEVKAGAFDCKKLEVTVSVQGKDYTSVSWYSKDVWKIAMGAPEHGGLVASEGSGSKMSLDGKGEDAKPTVELPKK
jgi:hypothetical protein